jgi:two-component system response regulator VicR
VLIIEDEHSIVDILRFNLNREGYEVRAALDGQSGLDSAQREPPDLILLDVMLPKLDGFEVCKRLRASGSHVPVIMLTAREDEEDKVLGLELGADDYITKPFRIKELLARVKANIRRSAPDAEFAGPSAAEQHYGPLTIRPDRMEVLKRGAAIELSQREYELLAFVCAGGDRVFSREELLEKVWNYEYYGDLRTVDVTVRRLREKIEDDPADPKLILTKRGIGYYFGG